MLEDSRKTIEMREREYEDEDYRDERENMKMKIAATIFEIVKYP